MKAGTTSLFNYLSQHPDIAASRKKEPNFFSHHYDNGIESYLKLWEPCDIRSKVLMEASTNYAKYPSFPASSSHLFEFSQQNHVSIRFIYVLRNPIDRIESQYNYSFARHNLQSLDELIRPRRHLVNVSRYAQQLDQYTDKFKRKDFLILDFDNLKNKPEKVLKDVCSFLNIDRQFQFSKLNTVFNRSSGAPIVRPIVSTYTQYPAIKKISDLFPKSFKRRILDLMFPKLERKFRLTEEQRQRVIEALKGDMGRLRDKYHIDVEKWGF